MTTRIGINGFGRIGRQVTRSILERHSDELEIVAVNDLTDTETNAHLFKYDTNYGRYPGTVEASDGHVVVDGRPIKVFSERDPPRFRGAISGSSWSSSPRASSQTPSRPPVTCRAGPRR